MTDNDPQASQRIDHFFARADRWRELASLAQRRACSGAEREIVEAAFEEVALLEEFHAFPGHRLMTALRERLAGADSSAEPFAALVRRISSAIVTRDYKRDPSEWETDDSADTPADVLPPTLGETAARRPYFEVLVVTPKPAAG